MHPMNLAVVVLVGEINIGSFQGNVLDGALLK